MRDWMDFLEKLVDYLETEHAGVYMFVLIVGGTLVVAYLIRYISQVLS